MDENENYWISSCFYNLNYIYLFTVKLVKETVSVIA